MYKVCVSARNSCEYAHFQTAYKMDNNQIINTLNFWHGFCSIINKRTTKFNHI